MSTLSRTDDLVASYSSKGPTLFDHIVKPDLVAPGNRIISQFVTGGNLESSGPGNLVPISYDKNVGNSNDSDSSSAYYTLW